jgi:hypothetical protein
MDRSDRQTVRMNYRWTDQTDQTEQTWQTNKRRSKIRSGFSTYFSNQMIDCITGLVWMSWKPNDDLIVLDVTVEDWSLEVNLDCSDGVWWFTEIIKTIHIE